MTHTVAILQARMSSSRLPGKVLLDLGGQPMLARVVERTRRARLLDEVVIATTVETADNPIAQFCAARGYACFRGSLNDVLDRYYQAALHFKADVIVRLTADCPVIDSDVIDRTIQALQPAFHDQQSAIRNDFAANRLPPPWKRTTPIGLDVEVVRFTALARAWREADQPFQREHVMPYFYEGLPMVEAAPAPQRAGWFVTHATSPRGFGVAQLHHYPDYSQHRWTVDTPADLELLRAIYARLDNRDDFFWQDVRALLAREPELMEINAEVQHKTVFDVDERRKVT